MARKNPHKKAELLQGTLDMLILKSLANGRSLHGYAVAQWIQPTTDEALKIEEGSLYPALHRMKRRGWVESEWGLSESNRRAKYYQLTALGKTQLTQEVRAWRDMVQAITLVLNANLGEAQ
jgi:PadR family transcriptional regulator PadR